MEYYIKVVVLFEALGGVVFVGGESDVADVGAAFDFDEADVDGGLWILRMRLAGNEVEAADGGVMRNLAKAGVRSARS